VSIVRKEHQGTPLKKVYNWLHPCMCLLTHSLRRQKVWGLHKLHFTVRHSAEVKHSEVSPHVRILVQCSTSNTIVVSAKEVYFELMSCRKQYDLPLYDVMNYVWIAHSKQFFVCHTLHDINDLLTESTDGVLLPPSTMSSNFTKSNMDSENLTKSTI